MLMNDSKLIADETTRRLHERDSGGPAIHSKFDVQCSMFDVHPIIKNMFTPFHLWGIC